MPRARTAEAAGIEGLLPALRWLDARLTVAAGAAEAVHGVAPGEDPFQGLYVTGARAQELLSRDPAVPALRAAVGAGATQPPGARALRRLARTFGLEAFDLDVLLLAAAPELDLRYERVYGFLQDDVTRRRPTVDLALSLFCSSMAERARGRARLGPDAPLRRHRLVALGDEGSPLLARPLAVDERIVALLLGEPGLDPRLRPYCQLMAPVIGLRALVMNDELRRALRTLAREARAGAALRLSLHGSDATAASEAAEAIARAIRTPLLVVDPARARRGWRGPLAGRARGADRASNRLSPRRGRRAR